MQMVRLTSGADGYTGTAANVTDLNQVADVCNPCTAAGGGVDTDGDGVFDFCDLDDDNDGILDSLELDNVIVDVSNSIQVRGPSVQMTPTGPYNGPMGLTNDLRSLRYHSRSIQLSYTVANLPHG